MLVTTTAASVHAEVLGHIVENRVVQDALLERLHDCDMGLLANARLEQMRRSGDDWLLTLADGRMLRAPLVIAADGANSAVRRLAGVATREWDYLHHAIVTSVRCAKPHQMTAWQRFTGRGKVKRWMGSARPRRATGSLLHSCTARTRDPTVIPLGT